MPSNPNEITRGGRNLLGPIPLAIHTWWVLTVIIVFVSVFAFIYYFPTSSSVEVDIVMLSTDSKPTKTQNILKAKIVMTEPTYKQVRIHQDVIATFIRPQDTFVLTGKVSILLPRGSDSLDQHTAIVTFDARQLPLSKKLSGGEKGIAEVITGQSNLLSKLFHQN